MGTGNGDRDKDGQWGQGYEDRDRGWGQGMGMGTGTGTDPSPLPGSGVGVGAMGAPRGGRGQERGAPLGASLIDIITANEGGRGALGSRFTPPSSPPCLSFPSPPVGTRGDVTAPPVPRPRAAGWGRGWLSPGVTRGVTRLTCLGTGSENELITPEEGFVPPHGGGLGFGDALVAPPWRPPVWWHRLGVTRCGRDRGVSPPRGVSPSRSRPSAPGVTLGSSP